MAKGLSKTFTLLKKTDNLASLDILRDCLNSGFQPTREAALRIMLTHRNMDAKKDLFRKIPKMSKEDQAVLMNDLPRLERLVHAIIKSNDTDLLPLAITCVSRYKLYETMPVLSAMLADVDDKSLQKLICEALWQLTGNLYKDLASASQPANLDTPRHKATAALEEAVGRYSKHQDKRLIDAFLMLTKSTNATLRRIIQSPKESSHDIVVERLQNSDNGGVMRLLLGYLDDPQMPVTVRKIICGRSDLKFVVHMLETLNMKSQRVMESIARFDKIAWAKPGDKTLMQLSEMQQAKALELLGETRLKQSDMLEVLIFLLKQGEPEARRVAAQQIAEFEDESAVDAVIECLQNDEDAHVRAHLLKQLRPRDVPSAMSTLIQMVDIDEIPIKMALRETLPEFSFEQFIRNFEDLPEQMLLTTGNLVAKIDVDSEDGLIAEMKAMSPVRRRKGITASIHMGLVRTVEDTVLELLNDDDHTVRFVAAQALADCDTLPSWDALRDAMLDRSVIVQQAAEDSLLRISQALAHRTKQADEEETDESENLENIQIGATASE